MLKNLRRTKSIPVEDAPVAVYDGRPIEVFAADDGHVGVRLHAVGEALLQQDMLAAHLESEVEGEAGTLNSGGGPVKQ